MIQAGDFRKGTTFEMDGDVWQIIDFQHVKPGKGAAFVRTKIRSVMTGSNRDMTFNPNEKYEEARIETREMQYLYNDGTITQTEPGIKGNTATGATKPATVETGATVNVPLFVNEGDKIKIDTRTGEYLSRV